MYTSPPEKQASDHLVSQVQQLIEERLAVLPLPLDRHVCVTQLISGKMLRTRLADRLDEYGIMTIARRSLEHVCAATEMAYTASLCHDDVIDGALVPHHRPALWGVTTPVAAVLIGDILLGEAMDLLLNTDQGRYAGDFVSKIREASAAEAEHELRLRAIQLDDCACLRLARSKTGSLFGFVGYACGSGDGHLSFAPEKAGYLIGTAYQLAHDLVDATGGEQAAGTTFGTDSRRRKFALPAGWREGPSVAKEYVAELFSATLGCLDAWPCAQTAVEKFFSSDLQPVLDRCELDLAAGSELVT